MDIDIAALGFDPWTRWYLTAYLADLWPLHLVTLALIVMGTWCLWQSLSRDGCAARIGSLAGMTTAMALLIVMALVIVPPGMRVLERINLARELGVPPPQGRLLGLNYPFQDRLARMTSEPTRQDEVRELLRLARVRYQCLPRDSWGQLTNSRAEKYIFSADRYDSPRALVINVFYDSEGFVKQAGIDESADSLSIEDCELS